jgi:hypothetical protein
MKIDPYKSQKKYENWKEKVKSTAMSGLSTENSEIIKRYLSDMEMGINISKGTKKGGRSYIRLNVLKERLKFLAKNFEYGYNCSLTEMNEENIHKFFFEMRNGNIKKVNGGVFKSTGDYVKDFKSFWHWYIKIRKKGGTEIYDLSSDLDTQKDKPKWVYLTEDEVKNLCNEAKYKYKVLIMFLFDTGVRSPTELFNIKVSDFSSDFKELNIRDEISKTFGRKFKIMICSELIKEYVKLNNLTQDDFLFDLSHKRTNEYLKRLAVKVFGDKESPAGARYSDLTMYDFRHISCCYWLPRYKSESALKYRFGWKKSDKIHYYSELLGMRDTIQEDDMLIDVSKTEIEKKLERSEREKEILISRLETMEMQMKQVLELTNQLGMKIN